MPYYLTYGSLAVSFLAATIDFQWLSVFAAKIFILGLILIFVARRLKKPEKLKQNEKT